MRNTFIALAFGLWAVGCGGTNVPVQSGGDVDMAQATVAGNGGGGGGGGGSAGGGGGGGGGGSVAVDMAGHHGDMGSHNGGGDMASTSTDMAGKAPFGAPCTANAQCASDVCFIGGMQSFCSLRCTTSNDCPVPPTSGVCNNQGYCK